MNCSTEACAQFSPCCDLAGGTMVVADAPARALVIVGDGFMQSISPSHLHLHALAASGACGFLALRHIPPRFDNLSRSLYEMQQLLDVNQLLKIDATDSTSIDGSDVPSIAERFMGMKAALITNSEPMANLGKSLGFTVSNKKVGLIFTEPSTSEIDLQLPASANVASELLELLGLSTPSSKDWSSFELVLLHLSDGSSMDRDGVSRGYLNWIDAIVGDVKALMQPGTKASDHLYLSLVLSYDIEAALRFNVKDTELQCVPHLNSLPTNIRSLRPQQTYKRKDGSPVLDVRDHHPMLVVHQMDGVTRRDSVPFLDFEEFCKNGCNLTILADRFLHEVAFKLWKAPKYGA